MYEKPEAPPIPKIYEIDISDGWDTESQIEEFYKGLKNLPFYKPGLLYSGFDGERIGKSWSSASAESVVFCQTEDAISYDKLDEIENPFAYALDYKVPALAIYDPAKLECEMNEAYRIKDKTALIAIIKFKV